MTDDEKADYIAKRLVEVKRILDEIAEKTGYVFICADERCATIFKTFGDALTSFMLNANRIVAERFILARECEERELNNKEETK